MKLLILLTALSITSETSFAWRELGHFAVCEIAFKRASRATQNTIKKIFENKDFAEQCTWPDMVRKSKPFTHTKSWHFINLNDGDDYFTSQKIDEKGDVVQAIAHMVETIPLTKDNEIQKQNLRFLGHFVGDLHQPLHVGRSRDFGGNLINLTWKGQDELDREKRDNKIYPPRTKFKSIEIVEESSQVRGATCGSSFKDEPTGLMVKECTAEKKINLHKFWDLTMLEEYSRNIPQRKGDRYKHKAYAKIIDKGVDNATRQAWTRSGLFDWAQESVSYRKDAYGFADDAKRDLTLKNYYAKVESQAKLPMIDLLNLRILQAGYRLAHILDQLFKSGYDGKYRNRFFFLKMNESLNFMCDLIAQKGASSPIICKI